MRVLIVESDYENDIDCFIEKREYLNDDIYNVISGTKKIINELDINFGYEFDDSIVFCNIIEEGNLLDVIIKILTKLNFDNYKCLVYMKKEGVVEYKKIYKNKLIKG